MFPILLIIGIALPIIELVLLVYLSGWIGFWWTIGIIAITGVLGVSLFRLQGRLVQRRLQRLMLEPTKAADTLADGAMIFFAAGLLLTPGVITDALGFLLLIPITRGLFKVLVWKHIQNRMRFNMFSNASMNPFAAMQAQFEQAQQQANASSEATGEEEDFEEGEIIEGFIVEPDSNNYDPDPPDQSDRG